MVEQHSKRGAVASATRLFTVHLIKHAVQKVGDRVHVGEPTWDLTVKVSTTD